MPVEFIGIVHGQNVSEIHPAEGPPIDKAYVRAIAGAHEAGGFDRVLIAHHSNSPDGYLTAAPCVRAYRPPRRPAGPPAGVRGSHADGALAGDTPTRTGAWRCTSSPAVTTRSSGATATTWTRRPATPGPANTWTSSSASGPRTRPSITRANTTASRAGSRRSSRRRSPTCRSISAARRNRRSAPRGATRTCSPYGENPWRG